MISIETVRNTDLTWHDQQKKTMSNFKEVKVQSMMAFS